MTQRPPVRRAAVLLAGIALVGTGAAGCGANRYSQTFREQASIDPTNADFGPIQLRNAALVAAADKGQDVLMQFSLYGRQAATADTLRQITIPELSSQPLQLLTVAGGRATPVQQIAIPSTTTPGPSTYAALVSGITSAVRPATYVKAVFAFSAAGVQAPLDIPVLRPGEVGSPTTIPTVVPDVPLPQPSAGAAGVATPRGDNPGTIPGAASINPTASTP